MKKCQRSRAAFSRLGRETHSQNWEKLRSWERIRCTMERLSFTFSTPSPMPFTWLLVIYASAKIPAWCCVFPRRAVGSYFYQGTKSLWLSLDALQRY